ncbi:MAG: PD-(D/E)XK nuclease family protein [Bacteroidales bacterium]|nr:PD-(D/E)XK nuclease family protein [Bacteroidales bacterium]
MENEKFLESVARWLTDRLSVGEDLADITVVCPNRRSAMFLKLYVQRCLSSTEGAVMMPRFATLQALAERRVGATSGSVPDRWEALMALYDSYRRVMARRDAVAGPFDRFIFWGDLLLGDFDDIDRSLADALAVYTNLRRLHEIRADYLTDAQREVATLLWGEASSAALSGGADRFWMHTGPGAESGMTDGFVALWEVSGELYDEYHRTLRERGMATGGMQLRAAAEALRAMGPDAIRNEHRRYVFAGHGQFSTAEAAMLDALWNAGVAVCLWDTAPLDEMRSIGRDLPRGLQTVARLGRRYPAPHDFDGSSGRREDRRIDVLGVPSAAGVAKVAGGILAKLADKGALTGDKAISTAVVVPDASLLMPLMLALPPEADAVNVTMALPASSTTVATLLGAVTGMQARSRLRRGRRTFFYKDVLEVLAHPHIRLIGADDAERLRGAIMRGGLYNVDADELASNAPALSFVFGRSDENDDVAGPCSYVHGLLVGLRDGLKKAGGVDTTFEISLIDRLDERVGRLAELIRRYAIEVAGPTVLSIFERLLQGENLPLTGTPLRGLQVMGSLETRAIDFDNIIYMSMNDRIIPGRDTLRTMIPAALRRAYGLPPVDSVENAAAYNFYRSIARAQRVSLIYDSRPAGKGIGEVSRYVTQLLYGGPSNVTHSIVDLSGEQPSSREISIGKTPLVMRELEAFKRPGGLNLSASALKTYMQCPLSFYLKYVKGYRDENQPTEYMSPAMTGDIFHRAMCQLYAPWQNREVTVDVINSLLDGDTIRSALLQQLAKVRFDSDVVIPFDELPAEARLIVSQLELQVRGMLEAERDSYCHPSFVYVAGERDIIKPWTVSDGLTVNLRMQIDRIDRVGDKLRFIDYKTGKDDNTIGMTVENLFTANHARHAIFQLLLYCEAYDDLVEPGVKIIPSLHILRKIMTDGLIRPLTYRCKEIEPYPALKSEFRPRLNALVGSIFDDHTPFGQAENIDACKYCTFLTMCGRNLPPERDNG